MTRMINISGSPIGPKRATKLMSGTSQPLVAAIPLILALTSTALSSFQAVAPQQPTFSSGVTQIEVYATVTDRHGRAVRGLTKDHFTVFENDVAQEITTFVEGEFPLAVALALDRSFSMRGTPLNMAKSAGRAFVQALRPADRAMLMSISGEVEALAPLTTDRGPLLEALSLLDPWSTTSLHDALIASLDLLEGETGRRAIVILSDGVDRYSTATASDVVARARRSDILMYPIAMGKVRPPLFAELATITGGRTFHVRNPKALEPALQAIAADLRSQYLLGYSPAAVAEADNAGWRRIAVKVNRPDVTVRARSGYSVQ